MQKALPTTLVLACVTAACPPSPPPCSVGTRTAALAPFLLGAAGVAQGTFGTEAEPDFAAGFRGLHDDGFNAFLPLFLTNESGEGTTEFTHFLPPSALAGFDTDATCAGSRNPWADNSDVAIYLPGYLLVPELSTSDVLDVDLYQQRLRDFQRTCLGSNASALGGIYLYDEPANNALVASITPLAPRYVVENVCAMSDATLDVLDTDVVIVEAAVPQMVSYYGLSDADRDDYLSRWQDAVDLTAPKASTYGMDFYAVDLTVDLSVIGDVVRRSVAEASQARPIAVLQGFGYADQGIDIAPATGRQPTQAETRAMAWEAVVAGAKGIFWYGQSALTVQDPGVWRDVRAVAKELSGLSDVIMLPPHDALVQATDGTIDASQREADDATWTFMVNPLNQPAVARLRLSRHLQLVDHSTGAVLSDGADDTVDIPFAPYAVVVVREGC